MADELWSKHRDSIAGLWKCISYAFYDTSGSGRKLLNKPHGDDPLGRVQISRYRYLSAHIAMPDRMQDPLPSGKAWQIGDDAEVAYVARACSMYCGHFELFEDDEGLYWQTKVEISMDPSRIGGIEERKVEVFQEGGKSYMILRPTRNMIMQVSTKTSGSASSLLTIWQDGGKATAELKWERIE